MAFEANAQMRRRISMGRSEKIVNEVGIVVVCEGGWWYACPVAVVRVFMAIVSCGEGGVSVGKMLVMFYRGMDCWYLALDF